MNEKEAAADWGTAWLIVDRNGRVKKNGKVTVNGYRYTVEDYMVMGTPE